MGHNNRNKAVPQLSADNSVMTPSRMNAFAALLVACILSCVAMADEQETHGVLVDNMLDATVPSSSDTIPDFTPEELEDLIGSATLTVTNFFKQLAAPSCDPVNVPSLPAACRMELEKIPYAIEAYTQIPNIRDIDVSSICTACNMEDVVRYVDAVRSTYDPSLADGTCDGAAFTLDVEDSSNQNSFVQLGSIMLTSFCSRNEEGELCFSSGVLPRVMADAIDEVQVARKKRSTLNFANVVTDMDMMVNAVCDAMRRGGCCTGIMMEVVNAATDLMCLSHSSPSVLGSFETMSNYFCPGIKPACSTFPTFDYQLPAACPEGGMREMLESMADLVPVKDTMYGDCTTDGRCPANDCEMYLCSPGSPMLG